MKRRLLQIAAIVAMVAGSCWLSSAADARLEDEVKAAFLYNFAKFVGWPDAVFAGDDDALVFCLRGNDSFAESVDRIVSGRTAHGREIVVRRDVALDGLDACHLLFLGEEEAGVAQIMQFTADTSVLTVGDVPSFVDEGGIIGLVVDRGKVRFEINAAGAERAGLRISSQLLKLARSVKK